MVQGCHLSELDSLTCEVPTSHSAIRNIPATHNVSILSEKLPSADVEGDGDAPERPHPTTSMSLFVLSPPLPSPSRCADVVSGERNRLRRLRSKSLNAHHAAMTYSLLLYRQRLPPRSGTLHTCAMYWTRQQSKGDCEPQVQSPLWYLL